MQSSSKMKEGNEVSWGQNARRTRHRPYAYGAWGSVAGTTGATIYPYLYVGQLGYYTHTSDQGAEAQSWLSLGVRFYDPEIGRFERRDPIPQDQHSAYDYVFGKPARVTDVTGKTPWADCIRGVDTSSTHSSLVDLIKCILTSGSAEKALRCIKEKAKGLSVDTICDLYACSRWTGDIECTRGKAGYPCSDPRSKTETAYCQACTEFNYQKCLCKGVVGAKKGGSAKIIAVRCQSERNSAAEACP